MVYSRVYVPSIAVLRCLSRPRPLPRPRPLRCHFARPLSTTFTRYQGFNFTPNHRPGELPDNYELLQELDKSIGEAMLDPAFKKQMDEAEVEMREKGLLPDGVGSVEYVQQDDEGLEKIIHFVKSRGDMERLERTAKAIEQWEANPNYDDREFQRLMIDEMMLNPNFEHLRENFELMREGLLTREELEAKEAKFTDEERAEKAAMIVEFHTCIQKNLDAKNIYPEMRAALENLRETYTDWKDLETTEFRTALTNIDRIFYNHPFTQAGQIRMKAKGGAAADYARALDMEAMIRDHPEKIFHEDDDWETTLRKLNEIGGPDPEFDAQIAEMEREEQRRMQIASGLDTDDDQITEDLEKMLTHMSQLGLISKEELEETPEDKAEVDRIMALPHFPKKVAEFREVINDVIAQQNDLTLFVGECAPERTTWDESGPESFRALMNEAQSIPEHAAALRRIPVKVQPPFHVAPAIRHFNMALKMAYVGANDDVRRVLWRSYSKARVIPTFLQSICDEAWDLLWYSQSVNWKWNRNRRDHLTILLHDLQAVGKDGPPTDPRTLNSKKS